MKTKDLKVECEKVWESLPSLDITKPDEDFFDQGGTSLTLIKLLEETQKQFNIELDINELAQGLTLNIYNKLVEQKINK